MATRLLQTLTFNNVGAGATVQQAHNININGTAVRPDFVVADAAGFTVAVTATTVSVTNNGAAPASVNVWLERKHSIPRQTDNAALVPSPFVAAAGGGGDGVVNGDSNIQSYTTNGTRTLAELALSSTDEGATYAIDFIFNLEPNTPGDVSYQLNIDDGGSNVYIGQGGGFPALANTIRIYGRAWIRFGAVAGPNQSIANGMALFTLNPAAPPVATDINNPFIFNQALPIAATLRVTLDYQNTNPPADFDNTALAVITRVA